MKVEGYNVVSGVGLLFQPQKGYFIDPICIQIANLWHYEKKCQQLKQLSISKTGSSINVQHTLHTGSNLPYSSNAPGPAIKLTVTLIKLHHGHDYLQTIEQCMLQVVIAAISPEHQGDFMFL